MLVIEIDGYLTFGYAYRISPSKFKRPLSSVLSPTQNEAMQLYRFALYRMALGLHHSSRLRFFQHGFFT